MTGNGPLTRRIQARRSGQQLAQPVSGQRPAIASSAAAPTRVPEPKPLWRQWVEEHGAAKDLTGTA